MSMISSVCTLLCTGIGQCSQVQPRCTCSVSRNFFCICMKVVHGKCGLLQVDLSSMARTLPPQSWSILNWLLAQYRSSIWPQTWPAWYDTCSSRAALVGAISCTSYFCLQRVSCEPCLCLYMWMSCHRPGWPASQWCVEHLLVWTPMQMIASAELQLALAARSTWLGSLLSDLQNWTQYRTLWVHGTSCFL